MINEKSTGPLISELAKKTDLDERQVATVLDALGFEVALGKLREVAPDRLGNLSIADIRCGVRLSSGTVAM